MRRRTNVADVARSRQQGSQTVNNFVDEFTSTQRDRPNGQLTRIKISDIDRKPNKFSGANPRNDISQESIDEIAASIKSLGLIQPIVVLPPNPEGKHPLVAGERRIRGTEQNGETKIDAIIKTVDQLAAENVRASRLVENIQREDLSKADRANAVRDLLQEFGGLSIAVAEKLGKSEGWVSQQLAFAELLASHPAAAKLDATAAARIITLQPKQRGTAIDEILSGGGSLRERTAEVVKNTRNGRRTTQRNQPTKEKVEAAITKLTVALSEIPKTQKKFRSQVRERIIQLAKEL